jgi:ABC-2 type transport system ATP-binding protein
MDEAARCHELVCIAYGTILARGTETEIIEASQLKVWAIEGQGAQALLAPMKAQPGVLSVAAFGNAVHVAGLDAALVEQALAPLRAQTALHIGSAPANLEDVFISLIARAQDNFSAASVLHGVDA